MNKKTEICKEDLKLFASIFKGKADKHFLISKLEQTLDIWCKKADRDIFIVPPEDIDEHIDYLIEEINKTVRGYAKLIHSGKKFDDKFVRFFSHIMREVKLN
mgnify:FL=1